MSAVLLRTLTLRSYLKFGRFYDLTVGEVIKYKSIKGLKYLTWSYYNMSMISFNQEILDILGITKKNEIDKPGKCDVKTFFKFLNNSVKERVKNEDLTDEEKDLRARMNRKKTFAYKKMRTQSRKTKEGGNESKEINQYRNQRKYSPF